MKICAIICELNPLHNGHKYLFDLAREKSGCDLLLLIMSGSFSQRGEMCILDKYTRAKHAILCGADVVLELPAPFAVAPAEIFAKGAIKILSSIPEITTLTFGVENDNREELINYATLLQRESDEFKEALKSELALGKSYITAYNLAFESIGGNAEFINKPNNILALEYTKAILGKEANIDILPIKRIGSGFNQTEIMENFSSASGIRKNITNPLIKDNVPKVVYSDLKTANSNFDRLDAMARLALLNSTPAKLADIYGCSEGLENKLKDLSSLPLEEIVSVCTSLRYSSSRINRILVANLLNLSQKSTDNYLNSSLFIQPLAIRSDLKESILQSLSKSNYPLLLKHRDLTKLSESALSCYNDTKRSYDIWQIIANKISQDFDYMQLILTTSN